MMKNRIEQCRIQAGMTRNELAREANVSESSLELSEKCDPLDYFNAQEIEAIAHTLNVNPAYLVGWFDDPSPAWIIPSEGSEWLKAQENIDRQKEKLEQMKHEVPSDPEQWPVKITLDDGRVIYDPMQFGDIDIGSYDPYELYSFKKSAIMAGHIVSIEADGDRNE